jgi:hypothetical protein
MISRVNITREEFDRRRDRLRSRWDTLIKDLKAGKDGDVFMICLRAEENTGTERRRARQSIYAITKFKHFRVSLHSTELGILVMHCGVMEPAEIPAI